jgi:hypothetical protein
MFRLRGRIRREQPLPCSFIFARIANRQWASTTQALVNKSNIFNISNVSVPFSPSLTQNFVGTHCSFSSDVLSQARNATRHFTRAPLTNWRVLSVLCFLERRHWKQHLGKEARSKLSAKRKYRINLGIYWPRLVRYPASHYHTIS